MLVALFVILVIVFSFPAVQTRAAHFLTDYLNDTYDVNIDIETVAITYSGSVELGATRALDHHQDTVISFEHLSTSVMSFSELVSSSPALGDVSINELYLNMRRYKGEESDNLNIFLNKFATEPSSQQPFTLNTGTINLTNAQIRIIDDNANHPQLFVAKNLNLNADNFRIDGNEIFADIQSGNFEMFNGAVSGPDGTEGFTVKQLKADFYYSPVQIRAGDLNMETLGSSITGDLQMDYEEGGFSDFVEKVIWTFDIKKSSIATNEINIFYNEFAPNETAAIAGKMTGTLNDFKIAGLSMNALSDLSIEGDMQFRNLIKEADNFFIDGTFDQLQVSYIDLKKLLPNILGTQLPATLNQLGTINANGYASVDRDNVISKLSATSRQGFVDTDLKLTEIRSGYIGYSGNIKATNFYLGGIVNAKDLGAASLNLTINGRGFDPETARLTLNGAISRLSYNGYNYKNIKVNGDLRKPLFNGKVLINDPNLQMEFDGLVDISKEINTYDFKAFVDYADLKATNIFTRDSTAILKGEMVIDMNGTNINDAAGTINFSDASYQNDNDTYFFEDFVIESTFEEEERLITINSPDIIEGEVRGKFKIEEIPELFKNSIGNVYTNYRSNKITENQYLDYEFKIYDKIVDLFFPDIALGENTILKGQVASNEAQFRLTFRSPQIKVYDVDLKQVNIQVNNQNPLFNTYIKIDDVDNGFYDVKDFQLINVTRQDTLLFRTEFTSKEQDDDKYNLSFYHTINDENKSVVGIRKSDLKFQGKKWVINPTNENVKLVFDNDFKQFELDTLKAQHLNERITVAGLVEGTGNKNVNLKFDGVRISSLTKPIDSLKMRGRIDGELKLEQVAGNYAPSSDFTIREFEVNSTPLGDFDMKVKGNEDLSIYNVNAQLKNDSKRTFIAEGSINTKGEFSTIDVNADFNEFNLLALSPLGGVVIDQIRGFATGKANVKGKLTEPEIDGKLILNKAGLRIPYLNTDFDFEEAAEIDIKSTSFDFGEIQLRDTKYNTTGQLTGKINHKNFGFWELDLALESDRLLVLDTELTEESLYYGTAFIDGKATITGPTNELFIDVVATTGDGTIFRIPINDGESLGDTSAIYFLSPEEKEARLSGKETEIKEISGLELRFDMEVTPTATVEVTVDPTNGSYLRGSGYGNLLLEINTTGKFVMNGDFIVTEGIYNFKYAGIVNKEFVIEPGGTIDWNGDPTDANINVSASYLTRANPSVLLDNPNLNAQIPVEVITKLQGDLSFFDPEFEISFPNVNSVVKSELQYRLEDKSQRQLQALSLITAGSFYNPNSIGQNAVTGNLVESLSGIVNDIVSSGDSRLDFGVTYEASERNPNSDIQRSDRFGITLTTQISDRVFINGKLGVPVGSTTTSERAIIGNVEIEFLLSKSGDLRLKIFNRENALQQIGQQEGYDQGVGLEYSIDFNSIKELYKKLFYKNITKSPSLQKRESDEQFKSDEDIKGGI
ncbi:translocation/assembly module TamB domain-containing protein [Nonlabens antarcticus]|uniref:translocation/assembly module TamB domain-containing protein n=1 Tax=Nonlabens antarcticus TaxID=392714 RepID=UPI00293BABFF|nr:translocation/assembly module TamB domain-containing protein [Nonlabens antarcticus]